MKHIPEILICICHLGEPSEQYVRELITIIGLHRLHYKFMCVPDLRNMQLIRY